jgi:ribosomal protein L6P/L9E
MYLVEDEKIEYYTYIKENITEKEITKIKEPKENKIEKINIGQVLSKEKIKEKTEKEIQTEQEKQEISKNFKEEIMEIIKGITQGYTISLELKGIGYQAKISEITTIIGEKKKNEEIKEQKTHKGDHQGSSLEGQTHKKNQKK